MEIVEEMPLVVEVEAQLEEGNLRKLLSRYLRDYCKKSYGRSMLQSTISDECREKFIVV
jgi:hypothetical protein